MKENHEKEKERERKHESMHWEKYKLWSTDKFLKSINNLRYLLNSTLNFLRFEIDKLTQ